MSSSRLPTGLSLRPLVVRFTDPAMEDAHIDLVYERVDDDSERHWPRLIELTVGQVKQRVRKETLTVPDCGFLSRYHWEATAADIPRPRLAQRHSTCIMA